MKPAASHSKPVSPTLALAASGVFVAGDPSKDGCVRTAQARNNVYTEIVPDATKRTLQAIKLAKVALPEPDRPVNQMQRGVWLNRAARSALLTCSPCH